VPPDIRDLPRPVVGYVGGLHQWVDQRLVCELADAMPDASLALIGPLQTDVSALQHKRNVHLLGPRPHAQLPRYIKGFDVGLVPYRLSDYTAHVYPTKLNEYLAMGIPVVTTQLPEVLRFRARHGDVVTIAGEPERFVTAVKEAVRHASDGVERRLQVARANSWSARIAEMSALMESALARRFQ
jgi:glycosyltransferase involved in cell wall biosynthesis